MIYVNKLMEEVDKNYYKNIVLKECRIDVESDNVKELISIEQPFLKKSIYSIENVMYNIKEGRIKCVLDDRELISKKRLEMVGKNSVEIDDQKIENIVILDKKDRTTYSPLKLGYSLNIEGDKIRILCQNIIMMNINGKVFFKKKINGVVFNLKTGQTYKLKTIEILKKRASFRGCIKNMTYFNRLYDEIDMYIWLPKFEWENIFKKIKEYKQQMLKKEIDKYSLDGMSENKELEYLIKFNRHPLIGYEKIKRINTVIKEKKTNILSYIGQESTEESYKKDLVKALGLGSEYQEILGDKDPLFIYLYYKYLKIIKNKELVNMLTEKYQYYYIKHKDGRSIVELPKGLYKFMSKLMKDNDEKYDALRELLETNEYDLSSSIELYYYIYEKIKIKDLYYGMYEKEFKELKLSGHIKDTYKNLLDIIEKANKFKIMEELI